MRQGLRLGMSLQAGFLVWRVTSFVCGLLLLPAVGLILVGQYVPASVLLCAAVAILRGVWWLVSRRRRTA